MMYRHKKHRFSYPAGTVVFRYDKFDYGLRLDDEIMTGKPHLNVSTIENAEPFFTCPVEDLEEIG